MQILNVSQYTNKILEMASRNRLIEEISDFFRLFEARTTTIAHVYYANGDSSRFMNKQIIVDGVKQPNPMYGRIFKLSGYRFMMGREYQDALIKKYPEAEYDPDASINQEKRNQNGEIRKNPWERLPDPGRPCIKNIETDEVALPLVDPKTIWTKWVMIDDNGDYVEVEKSDIQQYLKPEKPYSEPTTNIL